MTPNPSKRFDALFHCWDRDNSGSLDEEDFSHLADALRLARSWASDSPGYLRIRAALLEFWDLMLMCVDADGNGSVDRSEFSAFLQMTAEQTAEFDGQVSPWVLELFKAIFEALDEDGDGHISPGEYALYLRALGSPADPQVAFKHIDLDGSGFVETSELETLLTQFFTSEQAAAGHWFVTGGWSPESTVD